MIDIETLGKSEFAPLVSIGAIEFKPEDNKALGREFYQVVDLGESVVGYAIDVDTLKWWMQQSDKAREVFKEQGQPHDRCGGYFRFPDVGTRCAQNGA